MILIRGSLVRTALLVGVSLLICSLAPAQAGEMSAEEAYESLFPLGVRGLPDAYAKTGGGATRMVAIERGLMWLAAHQSPNGGWEAAGYNQWCDGKAVTDPSKRPTGLGKALYDPGVTGMSISAFLGAGYTHRGQHPFAKTILRGLRYLRNIQDPEGCFGPRSTQQYVYNHAFGALAIVEAYALTGDANLREPAQRAIAFSMLARNPYWAWRYGIKPGDNDTSITGCMTTPLYLALQMNEAAGRAELIEPLDFNIGAFDGVRKWIDHVTDPTYGRAGYVTKGTGPARPQSLVDEYPGELSEATTAICVFLRQIIPGWEPKKVNDDLIQKGINLMLKLKPSWEPKSGGIDLYYWYYGTMAMRRQGGAAWDNWDAALAEALLGAQETSGDPCGVCGSWEPLGPWSKEDGGRVYSTAMALLMLEVPDRMRVLPADRSDLLEALETKKIPKARHARIVRALGLFRVPESARRLVPLIGGKDDALRAAAAVALSRLDAGRKGVRALGKLLSDERVSVRRAVVEVLRYQARHLKSLVAALQGALDDADVQTAVGAARALGAAGAAAAADALRAKLSAPDPRLQVAAAAAYWRVSNDHVPALPVFRAGLGCKHVDVRVEAAEALNALGPLAEPAGAELVKALKDESMRVRVSAAAALWSLGKERKAAVEAMAAALRAPDVSVRLRALEGLRSAGPEAAAATEALTRQLLSGSVRLRRAAAAALAAVGPAAGSAAAALAYSASAGPRALRADAAKAFAALKLTPGRAVDLLLPALMGKDQRLIEGAMLGLAAQKGAVVPRLIGELDLADEGSCSRVLAVLQRIGPAAAQAVPAVTEILASTAKSSLRCDAADVLGAIGPAARSAVDVLAGALHEKDRFLRLRVVYALGGVAAGSPEAVRVLAQLIESKAAGDRYLKAEAVRAIGTLGSKAAPALPSLVKLLANKEWRLRNAAIEALAALGQHSIDSLRILLREAQGTVREGAAEAIAKMGPKGKKAIPELIALVARGGHYQRSKYGEALSAIGKPAVRPLVKLLSHKNSTVRAEAARSLGFIGKDARSALSSLRKRKRDSSQVVAAEATRAIQRILAK